MFGWFGGVEFDSVERGIIKPGSLEGLPVGVAHALMPELDGQSFNGVQRWSIFGIP